LKSQPYRIKNVLYWKNSLALIITYQGVAVKNAKTKFDFREMTMQLWNGA
jgi:hypothetical protein